MFTKERFTTAIDISDGLLKIAAISIDKGEKSLCVLDSVKLTSDKEADAAKEIRSLVSKHKLGKSHLYVSFPRHLVTIRNVRLPAVNEDEVKNMAELQAIKFLPYSREEMVIAYKTIDTTKEGYTDILLILAQRKSVDRYVEIFKNAGISIEKMALSSEGLFNWYSRLELGYEQPVAVIDLDRHHTHIQIVSGRRMLFSRSVSFNTEAGIADKDMLLREIKLSFDSFLKEQGERVSRIILSGSEDYAKDLSVFFRDSLLMPCEHVEQLQRIKVNEPAGKSLVQFKKASFTYLLGIVLESKNLDVNLLPPLIIHKKDQEVLKNELIKTSALFLTVLVAAFVITQKKMNDKRAYLRKIDSRLKEIEPEVKRLSKLKENIELVQNQLAFQGSSVDIIRELYTLLPEDVSLALLEFEDKNRVLVRGTTKELSRAFDLLPILEKSPYFENVEINFATKRTFKNTEFADFEIICPLR